MKLHDAFVSAAEYDKSKTVLLQFRLVSVQDKPRDGSQGLYTTVSSDIGSQGHLFYHSRNISGSVIKSGAFFQAEINFLLSDEFTSSKNPFNINRPARGRLTISESIPAFRPYAFTFHNIDANASFNIEMKEIGELWVGLGSPSANSTHNVGWMIAFGDVTANADVH